MQCCKCKKELSGKAKFCPYCGTKVQEPITFSESKLTDIIKKQTGMTVSESMALAWRITHEYPENFRNAAFEIAQGKSPALNVRGVTCEGISKRTGEPMFDALEILRILSCDAAYGVKILTALSQTDTIKKG